ncbi:MAG: hypothetical protein ACJAQ9_001704, partial [Ilumatobacter sp.]
MTTTTLDQPTRASMRSRFHDAWLSNPKAD